MSLRQQMARIVGLNTGQQSFGGLFEPLISLVSQHENIEIFVDPVVFFFQIKSWEEVS